MEEMKSSGIVIDIERIIKIYGGEQYYYYEILVQDRNKEYYKIIFNSVRDIRVSDKQANLDRLSKMKMNDRIKSSVVIVEPSEYARYVDKESSGTIPMGQTKDYLITDDAGCLIEILVADLGFVKDPKLIKVDSEE